MKWRLSLSPSLRLCTSCGLFVSPVQTDNHHKHSSDGLSWWIIWDCPDGSFGTSLRAKSKLPDKNQQQLISSRILKIRVIHLTCLFRCTTTDFPTVHCKRKYPWRTGGFTQNNHELLYFIFKNNSMLCYQLFQHTSMYLNWRWQHIKGLTFGNWVLQVGDHSHHLLYMLHLHMYPRLPI